MGRISEVIMRLLSPKQNERPIEMQTSRVWVDEIRRATSETNLLISSCQPEVLAPSIMQGLIPTGAILNCHKGPVRNHTFAGDHTLGGIQDALTTIERDYMMSTRME